MVGNKGGFMAQHEHTIVVTDGKPIVLTEINEIWELRKNREYNLNSVKGKK
jgi:hypothetical protein